MIEFADGVISVMQGSCAAVPIFDAWALAYASELAGTCKTIHTGMQLSTRQPRCFEDLGRRRADRHRHRALLFA